MKITVDYDLQADKWKRISPRNLSDYVGRKDIISEVSKNQGHELVLDAGCGEGYVSRRIAPYVKQVIGIDSSKGMIACAKTQERIDAFGIEYSTGDIMNLPVKNSWVEVYISSMVVHYLTPEELGTFYSEIKRVLKKNGNFYVLTTHPKLLRLLQESHKKSMWFKEPSTFDYHKSRGKRFPIILNLPSGQTADVEVIHSTLEDHLNAIYSNNLSLESIQELVVPEIVGKQQPLFDDLVGKTTHVLFKGKNLF